MIEDPCTPQRQIRGSPDSASLCASPLVVGDNDHHPLSPVAAATLRRRRRVQSDPLGGGRTAFHFEEDVATEETSEMKEQPQCAVCLDNLLEPVTLSCGHTGCESCVSAWFGSVLQSARGGRLRCPAGCGGEVSGFPAVSVHLRNDIKARFGELRYARLLAERGLDTLEARAVINSIRKSISDWTSDDSLVTVGSLTAQRDWFMQQYYHCASKLRDSERKVRTLQENAIVVVLDFSFCGRITMRATGALEKAGLCALAIPTILCTFLCWTALLLAGIVVALALCAATIGSAAGYCQWTLLSTGQPFAFHDVSIECPGLA
eukprot:m.108075 g.108075  ORF g.108075 m.108075 type:complete len:319 (+) comp21190_c0_seq1:84-1040(+)